MEFIWHHQKQTRWNRDYGNIAHLLSLLARAMQIRRRHSMTNRLLISVAAAALIAGRVRQRAGNGTSREAPSAGSNVRRPRRRPIAARVGSPDASRQCPGCQGADRALKSPVRTKDATRRRQEPARAGRHEARRQGERSPRRNLKVKVESMSSRTMKRAPPARHEGRNREDRNWHEAEGRDGKRGLQGCCGQQVPDHHGTGRSGRKTFNRTAHKITT